jgi:hypothetical protein
MPIAKPQVKMNIEPTQLLNIYFIMTHVVHWKENESMTDYKCPAGLRAYNFLM